MHEELVAWLRTQDFEPICPCCDESICQGKDCAVLQAADAIEELNRELDSANELVTALYGAIPRWIPVTERLPMSGDHVLAYCTSRFGNMYGGRSYVCDAFHIDKKTKIAEVSEYDPDLFIDYDDEEDEYYWPEGWYEIVKNWDDFSAITIFDEVTHWMPLPEPPEGGADG